jgi:hypothetical protein
MASDDFAVIKEQITDMEGPLVHLHGEIKSTQVKMGQVQHVRHNCKGWYSQRCNMILSIDGGRWLSYTGNCCKK